MMLDWFFKWWITVEPSPPDEPAEEDHFYTLEQAVQDVLSRTNRVLANNPDNHHLEFARNHLSDAYVALWRASQWWQKYHREAG